MNNPLDRWPVKVCGKCGGRHCPECDPAKKIDELTQSVKNLGEQFKELRLAFVKLASEIDAITKP